LRKLGKLRISKERNVAKELVADVSEGAERTEEEVEKCCFFRETIASRKIGEDHTAQGCRGALCGA